MKKILILIMLIVFSVLAESTAAQTNDTPAVPETTVCLSQSEANQVFALAEKGKKFEAYERQTEKDILELKDVIKNRDQSIVTLQITAAKAVQDSINLSNQAIRDNAALEQYRQYFFTKRQPQCKFAIVCVP